MRDAQSAGVPDRAVARSRCAVLFAAALTSLVIAAPGAGAQDGPAKATDSTERARANPPRPWRAYPLNQIDQNLTAQAAQDACHFEARQKPGTKALLILSFGRVSRADRTFGTGTGSDFKPNNRIHRALVAAGKAYRDCRGNAKKRVAIAYGYTNYELSQEIGGQSEAKRAGKAQRAVAKAAAKDMPRGVGTAVAGDIEPGWDHFGSDLAISLARGGAKGPGAFYNFGTSGHCRPYGEGCQGNWQRLDIGRVSQDNDIVALPEIYYPRQARSWALVANNWDRAKCRRPKKRDCYSFGGVTSHPTGCAGVEFTPSESWRKMRKATRRHVGRRIIYFNPRRVSCRDEGGQRVSTVASDTPAEGVEPGFELPLMPADVPAEIVEEPEPPFSETMIGEITNAWRVGSARDLTWVYAGRGPVDPMTGEPSGAGVLVVIRETYSRDRPVESTIQTVETEGTGALRITGAPLGARVTESAHDSGVIRWAAESGATGALDLSTLDQP